MCNSSLHAVLRALPKCEHHLHLEGALTPLVLFELAAKNKVALPSDDAAFTSPESLKERYNHFTSLDDFLHYYYIGMSVLVDAADFEALAWDYFQHAASDGVVHAEVFFDPQAHLSRGIGYDVVLSGFSAARQRAVQQLGVTSELICCFLRHLPVPDCLKTFEMEPIQESFRTGAVVGIGLDSSESPFPPELFKDIYQKAKPLGLKRTAHAGEEGPSTYIQAALDTLEVQRIDHGIRLAEDDELLKRVARDQIMLSVCPLSNVLLRCVSSVAELPIRKFLDHGVQFSINSDDPAYFGGHYILDNYCAVEDAFHLSVPEWTSICAAGIRGSWCSVARKEEMLLKLQTVIAQWSFRCSRARRKAGALRPGRWQVFDWPAHAGCDRSRRRHAPPPAPGDGIRGSGGAGQGRDADASTAPRDDHHASRGFTPNPWQNSAIQGSAGLPLGYAVFDLCSQSIHPPDGGRREASI
nr:adenine deaminase [Quercus suber]